MVAARRQTGGGQLHASMILASDELMALDYIGREAVIGKLKYIIFAMDIPIKSVFITSIQ